MQSILIYGGIGINIIGALLLGIGAARTMAQNKNAEKMPLRKEEIKAKWGRQRVIAFGLIFAGLIIALIGCVI